MAYQKQEWIDRVIDPAQIDPETGKPKVVQEGTRFTSTRANHFEQGIADAHNLVESLAKELGGNFVAAPGGIAGLQFSTSGLNASWTTGIAYVNGRRFDVPAGSMALNATQGQWLYLDVDGTVKKTTSQATADAALPLWYFATDASQVITSTDKRNILYLDSLTIDPTQVPTGNTGKWKQFFSWFANRIKAITGKTNWYDAPAISLETVSHRLGQAVNTTSKPTFVEVVTDNGSAAGGVGHVTMRNNSGVRFRIGLDGNESAGDKGAYFAIWAYDNNGNFIDRFLCITRDTKQLRSRFHLLDDYKGNMVINGPGYLSASLGNAGGADLNYGTGYIGLNALRDPNTGTWTSYTDTSSNGGSVIWGDVFGDLHIAPIANTGPTTQTGITDATLYSKLAFKVSGRGSVSHPRQSRAWAWLAGPGAFAVSAGVYTRIPFNGQLGFNDPQQEMNLTNGIFTAKEAGVYLVSAHAISITPIAVDKRFYLQVTAQGVAYALDWKHGSGYSYDSIGGTTWVNLNVGDTISIEVFCDQAISIDPTSNTRVSIIKVA
jgi:hypothetical protein